MPEVALKLLLGQEPLLALVLYQDLAGVLEEAFGGPLRREFDLAHLAGRQAGVPLGRRLWSRSTSSPLS